MRALSILTVCLFLSGCMEASEWRQPFPDGSEESPYDDEPAEEVPAVSPVDDGGDPDPVAEEEEEEPIDEPEPPAPDDEEEEEAPSRPTDDEPPPEAEEPEENPDVRPVDEDEPIDEEEELIDEEEELIGGEVGPGGACACDSDCEGTATYPGLCIHGVCGARATSDSCAPGSSAECPAGHRCWSGTGIGICYPDFDAFPCSGLPDRDGSCVSDGVDCYAVCGLVCDLPGDPGDGPADCDDGGDSGGGG